VPAAVVESSNDDQDQDQDPVQDSPAPISHHKKAKASVA